MSSSLCAVMLFITPHKFDTDLARCRLGIRRVGHHLDYLLPILCEPALEEVAVLQPIVRDAASVAQGTQRTLLRVASSVAVSKRVNLAGDRELELICQSLREVLQLCSLGEYEVCIVVEVDDGMQKLDELLMPVRPG